MTETSETCMIVRHALNGAKKLIACDLTRDEARRALNDLVAIGRNPHGQEYEIASYVPSDIMSVIADENIRL